VPFSRPISAKELILIPTAATGYCAISGCFVTRIGNPLTKYSAIVAEAREKHSMSRFSSFLLGMATGAILLYGATLYHVVRAPDGFHFVKKQQPRLSETYVDIRAFTMTDWASHPQLASALVQANQQQLLGDSAAGSLLEGIKQALPAWPAK
jgi:hypothetical protein